MSDEKDFKKIFKKASEELIKSGAVDLDSPTSDEDIKKLKESTSNSYSSDNKKMINALKKD